MNIDPGEVLNDARKARTSNDYSLSLEKYEWFFDNAIKINKSYYGVRLSYCLIEWAELGSQYPAAKAALIKKKEEAFNLFSESKSITCFHEYESICDALECQNEAVKVFKQTSDSDIELSRKLFTYVYPELAKNKEWEICRKYMGNGYNAYKELLELFDFCIEGTSKMSDEQRKEINNSSVTRTVKELEWILEMQKYAQADDEVESALKSIKHDYGERGYPEIYERVLQKNT